MPLLIPLALLLILALMALLLPIGIVLRYRAGTARQRARRWQALLSVFGLVVSAVFFFVTATVNSFWVPGALSYSAAGFAGGLVLGLIGLRLTRWESSPPTLHYTPNKWLVLALSLAVTVRLAYGLWRVWHAWHTSSGEHSWLAESGLAGSMATGAVMLGYYLAYMFGVWWLARAK